MDINQILGNLGFDWRLALANLINFLIIFWLLKRYAFQPIKKILDKRQARIDAGLDDAKKAASELQMAEQSRDNTLYYARQEANEIITQARKEAEATIKESEKKAVEKKQEIIEEAKKAIATEKEKMLTELKQEIIEISTLAAEKILQQKIDDSEDKKIIKKVFDK